MYDDMTMKAAAHHHVAIPSVRYESFNVAMAGSIVLYDRLAKQEAKQQAEGQQAKNKLQGKQEHGGEDGSSTGGSGATTMRRSNRGSGDPSERATDENYDCTL